MRSFLCLAAFVFAVSCGPNLAKVSDGAPPDLGSEEQDLAANIPLVSLAEGVPAYTEFTSTNKTVAYKFYGHAGNKVDIFVTDFKTPELDTKVSLYKVSYLSGRPYGSAVAYNDDTTSTGWTPNPNASSIEGFSLPQSRNYAIVVSTYQHAPGRVTTVWRMEGVVSNWVWPATGAGTPVTLDTHHATLLPTSSDVAPFAYGAGHTEAERLRFTPSDLRATVTDGSAFALLAYELLYNNRGQDPTATPVEADISEIQAADAVSTLEAAANTSGLGQPEQGKVEEGVRAALGGMLADGAFASGARVFKMHWDNGDDMSSEGIVALNLTTGEVRLLVLYNDP
jgi:hypothetical protein